jgi:trk system potassium uptake protein TrkH
MMLRLSLDPKSGPIGVALGWLAVILGMCMGGHGLWAWILKEGMVYAFAFSALMSVTIGGTAVLAFSSKRISAFSMGQSFFLTLALWVVVSVLSALPIYFSPINPSLVDALFESVSALTTTGLSLFAEKSYAEMSLKFWVVFLQWLGGFGIVMTAVILLPVLRMGSGQLMSAESSDQSEKIAPRSATMATYVLLVYGLLTVCVGLCLKYFSGLPWWDSMTYAIASVSTGGISMSQYKVLDLSVGTKTILSMGMLMGSITLILFVPFFRGKWRVLLKDDQVMGMFKMLMVTCIGVAFWHKSRPLIDSVFMSISAVSGTGFPSESIFHFGGLFWIVTLIGGCSGSASGGIKIFRLQIMYRMAKNHINRMLNPSGFYPTVYNGERLGNTQVDAVMAVVFFYLLGWVLATTALTLCGHTLNDAFTLASSTLTNSGLPLGQWADHANDFSSASKWVSMLTMLSGRFECVTLVGAFLALFRSK